MKATPLQAYQAAVADGSFVADQAQQRAAEALQSCYDSLRTPPRRGVLIQGVYLWGPVGRGKTWLMDQFFQSLDVPARRQHFHHFMSWVHQRLFQLTGTSDPLKALAKELRQEIRVLCFDELFVNDIGDAVILGRLLQVMFEQGVILVATSNQPPQALYGNGHNRERFTPAIAAIERYMQIVAVDGQQDHRQHPGVAHQRYFVTGPGQDSPFAELFSRLNGPAPVQRDAVPIGHRHVHSVQYSDTLLWCRYADLCEQPLSALDFIGVCDRFQAILLSDVPSLSAPQRDGRIARGTEDASQQVLAGDRQLPQLSIHDDGVRRFIALVDECYDRHIPLYIQAHVPMTELYTDGYLGFAFRRALSRLQEMQLERYGAGRTPHA